MMTLEQRQARALQRASEQRARVRPLDGYQGVFVVRSATTPGERHTLVVCPDGRIECSCKAAAYGNACWHVEKVRRHLQRKESAA